MDDISHRTLILFLAVSGLVFGCSRSTAPDSVGIQDDIEGATESAMTPPLPPPVDKDLTPLQEMEMDVGRYGGVLFLSTAGDPKTFNPILGNEASSDVAIKPSFATCWGYDFVRQEEEPALCETYHRSDDGLTHNI